MSGIRKTWRNLPVLPIVKEEKDANVLTQVNGFKYMQDRELTRYNAGIIGGVFAFVAVALGAFGAHGLEGRISPSDLATFETGARYQMYHALALILVASAPRDLSPVWTRISVWGFALGILLFSGSLYALVLTGVRTLGAVTPLGGIAFLVGWVALTGAFFRRDHA